MPAARVLVVDDERLVLEIISQMVRRAGFEVFSAGGPRQGLEIVTEEKLIDLILCDVTMPVMGGPDLRCEIARVSPETSSVRMSGGAVDPSQLPIGVPLLQKPFSPGELISTVAAALGRAAEARPAAAVECKRNLQSFRRSIPLRSERAR